MNTILIVGSQLPASIENFYTLGLERLGLQVRVFEPQRYVAKGLLSRVRQRLQDPAVYRRANHQLIAECRATKPDVVWVFKGIELMPNTISAIKAIGAVVVNYNPDHPYIRTSITHGGRNVADAVSRYDLYFTYHRGLVEQLKPSSVWLPFGFHLPEADYEAIREGKEIERACFVGTVDRQRAELLIDLAATGIPIDVYGPRNRYARKLHGTPRLSLHDTVFDLDFWRILRSYRVQLNFFREHNYDSHNQRTFEVPASGGILLTPDTAEQREFFEVGSEVHFYGSTDDMRAKLDALLTMPSASARDIRLAARHRSVTADYSYARRAQEAYKSLRAIRGSG